MIRSILIALATCTLAAEGHGHGEAHDLGTVALGPTTVKVVLSGEAEHNPALDVSVTDGAAPTALRAWIGVANGRGSTKAKLGGANGTFHGHLPSPDPMPEGAALWVEAEDANGGTAKASLPLPADDHDHDHAEGAHEHKEEAKPEVKPDLPAGHSHEGHDHQH